MDSTENEHSHTQSKPTPTRVFWPPVYIYNNLLQSSSSSYSSQEKYVHSPFELCLVDWIEKGSVINRSSVSLTLNKDGLFLTPPYIDEHPIGDTFKNIPFEHYEECPMRTLTLENKFQIPKRVKVGVSVLIENENKKILITRRSKNLRTFPGVWVLPGGHCEAGESFFETGSREVFEETGVHLPPEKLSIFGVYESVFPVALSEGFPSDHHVVIYLHGVVSLRDDDLKLCPREVDMAAWISSDEVKGALHHEEHDPPLFFEVLEFSEIDKSFNRIKTNLSKIQLIKKSGVLPAERLSTGTRFVLREWLQKNMSH